MNVNLPALVMPPMHECALKTTVKNAEKSDIIYFES